MTSTNIWKRAAVVAAALMLPGGARGADHLDSPAAVAEPAADITDLYAWMSADASKLNLILNWGHNMPATAMFSDAVVYVFHVTSMASYGAADKQETQILCKFFARTSFECWAGGEYLTGAIAAPIESASKRMRAFAGRRNDPFFFELVGFQETVKKVVAAAPSLKFDANMCPAVDAGTSALLVKQLQSSAAISNTNENKPATNTFAGLSVHALSIQIDKALVTPKGPILGVWASTHRVK